MLLVAVELGWGWPYWDDDDRWFGEYHSYLGFAVGIIAAVVATLFNLDWTGHSFYWSVLFT